MKLPAEPLEAYEASVLRSAGADAIAWAELHQAGRTFVQLLEQEAPEHAAELLKELNDREFRLTLDCEFTSALGEALGGYSTDDGWLFGEAAQKQRELDEANATAPSSPLAPKTLEFSLEGDDCAIFTRIRNFLQNETSDDAACTSDAIYIVEQKRRVYGLDPDYTETTVWLDLENECVEATPRQAALLEALLEGDEPPADLLPPAQSEDESEPESLEGWQRTGCRDTWEFVQPFLTREAAHAFITQQQHNLGEARVYVASGCRNPEWQFLRRFFETLKVAP